MLAKAWKLVAIAGAIAGLAGFFLPFVEVERDGIHGSISAYQIVFGVDDIESWLDGGTVEREALDSERALVIAEFERFSRDYAGGMLVIYLPAIALLLAGLSGFLGGFGRGKAGFALVFGIAAWAVWGLFRSVDSATVSIGSGLHLLLATGLAGVAAGIGALVRPERRAD